MTSRIVRFRLGSIERRISWDSPPDRTSSCEELHHFFVAHLVEALVMEAHGEEAALLRRVREAQLVAVAQRPLCPLGCGDRDRRHETSRTVPPDDCEGRGERVAGRDP